MDAVNAYAEKIGCSGTVMNRLMLVDNGLQNYTTAKDCATLLKMIYSGKCVSEEYSETMLDLLKCQERTGKIPAGIPAGAVVANKTGELNGVSECDVAIVFGESEDYILCVLSEPENNQAAIDRIIEISDMTYRYITNLS
jgi:beta-lactamase class A